MHEPREPGDIASYLRANANELGSRILSTFPRCRTQPMPLRRECHVAAQGASSAGAGNHRTAKYCAKQKRRDCASARCKTYMALGAITFCRWAALDYAGDVSLTHYAQVRVEALLTVHAPVLS